MNQRPLLPKRLPLHKATFSTFVVNVRSPIWQSGVPLTCTSVEFHRRLALHCRNNGMQLVRAGRARLNASRFNL